MNKPRALKLACGIVAALVAVGALMGVTVSTRAIETCTLCRAERTERTFLGYSWQTHRDTEFTTWHQAHRPAHQHEWGRLTCTRGFSIFGNTTLFACGPRHPVCDIPPDKLRQFAEQADTNTLTIYFTGITSTNRDTQRQAVQMAWDKLLETK
jgi:hypothetical protein